MNAPVVLIKKQPLVTAITTIGNISVTDQRDEKRLHDNAIRHLIRKLDRKLLPFIVLLEISSFINRVSIGNTKLMGIQTDLHMSDSEKNNIVSLFYIAYFVFTIPSNLLMRFIGSTRYLALCMFAWGSITVGMAFVTNAQQLLIVRFLLGIAQAGYFPAIIIYFSFWYCKRERIIRIAILQSAAMASGALDGILTYGISQMKGIGGLKGWQWTFLFEGSPVIPLGIITYLFLDSIPNVVQWLTNTEKELLTNLLRNDAGVADGESVSSTTISWRQVRDVFIDWRIYLYGLINVGNSGVLFCLTAIYPTLVANMGYSETVVHLMTAPPYAVGCVCCVLIGYSSSRWNEHGYHLAFSLSIGLFGFILLLTMIDKGKAVTYVSTTIVFCGVFPAAVLLLCWLTNNIGGHTKRAIAISFVTALGRIGGILMPQIFREIDKPTYRRSYLICSGMLAGSLILTIILRICLIRENRRRANLSLEKYNAEAAIKDPCDSHPDVRYRL